MFKTCPQHKMNYNTQTIKNQVKEYNLLGIKTIPLKPRTKEAFLSGWQDLTHEERWSQGYNFNVGIELDSSLICIDADDKKTVKEFNTLLDVYNPPIVETRTGRHYYFKVIDGMWEYSYKKIKNGFSGEIRLQGCYVVAPPSFVLADNYKDKTSGDHFYQLVSGSFSDIPIIPKNLVDMWILKFCTVTTTTINQKQITTIDSTPTEQLNLEIKNIITVPLYRRDWNKMKYLADKIHCLNNNATPKLTYGDIKYSSRSEVFQSIIRSLILYQYNKEEIYQICIEHNLIIKSNVNYHFEKSYDLAIAYIITSNIISTLQELYYHNFKTRHLNDELVYKALVSIGIQFTTMKPYSTKFQLKKITGIRDYRSIQNSIDRLVSIGRLKFVEGSKYEIIGKGVTGKRVCFFTVNGLPILGLDFMLNLEKQLGIGFKIIGLLKNEELKTSDITKKLNRSKQTTINNLNKLLQFELIERRNVGRNTYYQLTSDVYDRLYEISVEAVVKNLRIIDNEILRLEIWRAEKSLYYAIRNKYSREEALYFIVEGRKQSNWFTEILVNNSLEDMIEIYESRIITTEE